MADGLSEIAFEESGAYRQLLDDVAAKDQLIADLRKAYELKIADLQRETQRSSRLYADARLLLEAVQDIEVLTRTPSSTVESIRMVAHDALRAYNTPAVRE